MRTAAHLAPEQERGKPAANRAEMLTSRKLFEGETISDILDRRAPAENHPGCKWSPGNRLLKISERHIVPQPADTPLIRGGSG